MFQHMYLQGVREKSLTNQATPLVISLDQIEHMPFPVKLPSTFQKAVNCMDSIIVVPLSSSSIASLGIGQDNSTEFLVGVLPRAAL